MKAISITKYGPPEALKVVEVEKPVPKKNELLIKIVATAINDYDWSLVRGKPYLYRLLFGLTTPRRQIPGMELSGIVEKIGADVETFKEGDAVYGDISAYGFGTFAEYLCINEKAIFKKPDNISFEEAAAIPHASLLALQALQGIGKIKKGQKVLLNGGGGGVGVLALQLAKSYDCEVTGVDTGDKLEMMKAIGFDEVIDYKKEDFTRNGKTYDLILDCKTNRSPLAYTRSLKPGGTYVSVGGTLSRLIQLALTKGLISRLYNKKLTILALKPNKGLDHVGELYSQGVLKCVIDGPYPLDDAPKLLRYFGEGKHTGKIVMTINNTGPNDSSNLPD